MERPEQWGPAMWDSMHAFAASYPDAPTPEDRARARAWFADLGRRLPCDTCAQKYEKLIKQLREADVQSRAALFEWTVRVHNIVNMLLGKPIFPVIEAKKKYRVSVQNDVVPFRRIPGILRYGTV
jgi:hypothetical protein